jgi:hypothetical protein
VTSGAAAWDIRLLNKLFLIVSFLSSEIYNRFEGMIMMRAIFKVEQYTKCKLNIQQACFFLLLLVGLGQAHHNLIQRNYPKNRQTHKVMKTPNSVN